MIDPTTLTRSSKAFAYQRFKDMHSNDRIYELLLEIYSKFNLDYTKIVAAIIDNGANFVLKNLTYIVLLLKNLAYIVIV